MNSQLLLDNLVSWSVEVAILVSAAGAAASVVLRHPRSRLYFWQAILGVALLLPAAALWNRPTVVAPDFAAPVTFAPATTSISPQTSSARRIEPVLGFLALGAVLRLLWVGAGLLRLSRIRRNAQPLREPPVAFSGDIRWYVSDQISGPVTFGWLRPSILLPAPVRTLPAGVQEAIASHELRHIDRCDWLFVIGEEMLRSLLWFHPAVWFVLSQIQLAREQVVDQEVVHATRDRAGYLDALMAVATHKLQPDVAPAPLFLKKRQLAVRVAAIVKENPVSLPRLAAHVTAAASVAIVGLCAAVWFFPLQISAQIMPDDPGITVDAGAILAHRPPVRYPQGSIATGDVLVELSLNSKGEVADARVLSGPEELRKAALASVLEWHYAADTAPPSLVRATIHFGEVAKMAPPPPPPNRIGLGGGIGPGLGGGTGSGLAAANNFGDPLGPLGIPSARGGIGSGIAGGIGTLPPESIVVQRIEYRGLGPELQQRVQNRLTVRQGDTLTSEGLRQINAEIQQIDEHLTVRPIYDRGRKSAILFIMLPSEGGTPPSAVPLVPLPGTYRIGGGVSAPIPISRGEPEYTEEARAAKLQGTVLLQIAIDESGVPQKINVVQSLDAGLDQKAIEAVQKWRFKPAMKDGKAVAVSANVEVNFRLL